MFDTLDVSLRGIARLAGLPEGAPVVERLTVPYVLLSTHYFVLDAIVDGHAEDPLSVLSTTPLLLLSTVLIADALRDANQRFDTMPARAKPTKPM